MKPGGGGGGIKPGGGGGMEPGLGPRPLPHSGFPPQPHSPSFLKSLKSGSPSVELGGRMITPSQPSQQVHFLNFGIWCGGRAP